MVNQSNEEDIDEEHVFKVVENFIKTKGVANQQIESFNEYINNGIQDVIDNEADIEIIPKEGQLYTIHFGDCYISPPSIIEDDRTLKNIYPNEVRNRSLIYDSSICCNITETLYEEGEIVEKNVHTRTNIGRTPIMLKSDKCLLYNMTEDERIRVGECSNDPGGYFIIRGNERVLVSQLRANYNQPIVLKQKPGEKYSYIAEIRSISEETGHSILLKAMIGVDNRTIVISLPYIKELLPIGIVFKALGFTKDDEIKQFINLYSTKSDKYIKLILRDSFFIQTQEEALTYIGNFSKHIIHKSDRVKYARQVCSDELFPHLGVSSTNKEISITLGHFINVLLSTHIGMRKPDDRDNYSNKRIETAGILCTELFKALFKNYIKTIRRQLEKKKCNFDALSVIRKINSITHGLTHSFSTGNWGVKKNAYIRTGVSQVMSRMTYGATLSHLRRIIIPVGKEGKNAKIRQIHLSQFGYICPSETPEGQTAGIVLNFSIMSRVTRKIPTVLVRDILDNNINIIQIKDLDLKHIKNSSSVFLNGMLIGVTEDPDTLIEEIIKMRRMGILDSDVSVTYDIVDNIVKIFCDAGRGSRPLFSIGENGVNIKKSSGYDWNKLVKNNIIEYIDNSEIDNYVIAMSSKHLNKWKNDYLEIHPSMLHGVMASTIPFPDHSPSPRNAYQCSMGKQAIGMYALSYQKRTDTIVHVLDYPQKPLVSTHIANFMGFDKMPSGINAVVAIMSYTGLNCSPCILRK